MAATSSRGGLSIATGLPASMLDPSAAAGPGSGSLGAGGSLSRPNRHASLRFASGTSDGPSRDSSNRNTNRYSVTALYSMAAEQDTEIEDELARCAPSTPSYGLSQCAETSSVSALQPRNACGTSKARYRPSRSATLCSNATSAISTRV